MQVNKFLWVIVIQFLMNTVHSARILAVISSPSYSHQITFRPLWKELSLRGHHVTLLTTDPINDSSLSNITEINLHSSYKFWQEQNMFTLFNDSLEKLFWVLTDIYFKIGDEQLSNPKVKSIIENKTEHFDLLVIEGFHSAFFAFAERFNCPFIIVQSLECTSFVYSEIRNPVHSVLNPDYNLPYDSQLSFSQRVFSVVYNFFMHVFYNHFVCPSQQLLVIKHFGINYSQIQTVYKNYSLFFIHTDTVLYQLRPLLPNVIQVGGIIDYKETQPLTESLQHILDNANQGIIYFSLGSIVKSVDISQQFRKIVLDAFRELPYLVLWKFENEILSDKPANVIISKWFPQRDILRHPNVKLFITQGGVLSISEAVYHHVPIIGIPVMSDQRSNIKRMVSKGCGLLIEFKDASKKDFLTAILEVINNPKYRNQIKQLAGLLIDQPDSALDRAVWWTEYVIRHKGARHLRNPALDLPWYQYYNLDVISLIIIVFAVSIYLLIATLKFFLKTIKYLCVKKKIKIH
ncbi:hypothetical protein RN001_004783 [Aquatica leii]|uniref:UDP-glucuronosyltransferase n=1 Tax=Aquatica leii TaxID=1421715 RepID=A0AAN7PYX2_9COLE|nr:hypothetical protein RN001_004783 [Aquatica leii]